MATKEIVQLVDDINGEPADETVVFALDGAQYEIDVSADHAQRLRDTLAEFVAAARRTGGRRVRHTGTKARGPKRVPDGPDPKLVREWGLAQGLLVSGRGRIPAYVVAMYTEAAGTGRGAKRRAEPARTTKPARTTEPARTSAAGPVPVAPQFTGQGDA